jgi:hypothetical protein
MLRSALGDFYIKNECTTKQNKIGKAMFVSCQNIQTPFSSLLFVQLLSI